MHWRRVEPVAAPPRGWQTEAVAVLPRDWRVEPVAVLPRDWQRVVLPTRQLVDLLQGLPIRPAGPVAVPRRPMGRPPAGSRLLADSRLPPLVVIGVASRLFR